MRISSISIKNFKSIDTLNNVTFRDRNISCVIGKNGSGKSNLLYAIYSLKYDKYLTDHNIYEKTNKEKEIIISGVIDIEENDTNLFASFDLNPSEFRSFKVNVVKRENETPQRTFEPINFQTDFRLKIFKNLKKISNILNDTEIFTKAKLQTDADKNSTEDLVKDQTEEAVLPEVVMTNTNSYPVEEIKEVQELYDLFMHQDGFVLDKKFSQDYLGSIEKLLEVDTTLSSEKREQLSNLIGETRRYNEFDIEKFIENELWNKLTINLLDLNGYPVETVVKKLEMKDDSKHPFLYDLLSLSGKTIEQFSTQQADLENTQQDASVHLTEELSKVWPQHKLKLKVSSQYGDLYFSFETPQKRTRGLDDLSDGQKWFLRFYTKLAIANQKKKQIIWLFDEPGQALHATAQVDLKTFFEEVSGKSQILYTSHQPMMIQWHRLERIQVAENTIDSGTTITSRFWKDEELVSPLKEALGLFVGEQMLTGTEHVVVEGVSDYIYLQGWLQFFQRKRVARHWLEDNASLNRTIIPAGGRDCMPLYLLFLTKRVKDKVSTIAIPDSSNDAERVKEGLRDFEMLSKRVKSIGELIGDPKVKDIEEIYQPEEFLKDVKHFYEETYQEVKLSDNFIKPTKEDLKNGLVAYINSYLDKMNPNYFSDGNKLNLDKPGVAFFIYSRLNKEIDSPYSKVTEKRFEKIFTSINSLFKS